MMLAGYRGVVATMWSISDVDGPVVAEEFYYRVIRDGSIDSTKAARALHLSIQALQEHIGEEQFLRWLPFIHIGI